MKKNNQSTVNQTNEANEKAEIIVNDQTNTTDKATDHAASNEQKKANDTTSEHLEGKEATKAATEVQPNENAQESKNIQTDIEEVDSALADLLASADFVTGNAANAVRQLNAILAVVNHEKGKRVKLNKSVLQKLNVVENDLLNVTVKNQQVIILPSISGTGIQLKKDGYLYNSGLVDSITNEFAFNFSNQSTHHLLNVSYKKWNNQVIAIITR